MKMISIDVKHPLFLFFGGGGVCGGGGGAPLVQSTVDGVMNNVLFLQAVINMMMAVETMLSPDTATIDDIEKMTKNAMDAWKELKSKNELAKGSTDGST
jgi:hypothetical protein